MNYENIDFTNILNYLNTNNFKNCNNIVFNEDNIQKLLVNPCELLRVAKEIFNYFCINNEWNNAKTLYINFINRKIQNVSMFELFTVFLHKNENIDLFNIFFAYFPLQSNKFNIYKLILKTFNNNFKKFKKDIFELLYYRFYYSHFICNKKLWQYHFQKKNRNEYLNIHPNDKYLQYISIKNDNKNLENEIIYKNLFANCLKKILQHITKYNYSLYMKDFYLKNFDCFTINNHNDLIFIKKLFTINNIKIYPKSLPNFISCYEYKYDFAIWICKYSCNKISKKNYWKILNILIRNNNLFNIYNFEKFIDELKIDYNILHFKKNYFFKKMINNEYICNDDKKEFILWMCKKFPKIYTAKFNNNNELIYYNIYVIIANDTINLSQKKYCSICDLDYKEDIATIETSCGHHYCINCINNSYLKKNECPMCRNILKKNDFKEIKYNEI